MLLYDILIVQYNEQYVIVDDVDEHDDVEAEQIDVIEQLLYIILQMIGLHNINKKKRIHNSFINHFYLPNQTNQMTIAINVKGYVNNNNR